MRGQQKVLAESLEGKPKSWAQVMAARAALRVLPFGLITLRGDPKESERIISLIRMMFYSWVVNSDSFSGNYNDVKDYISLSNDEKYGYGNYAYQSAILSAFHAANSKFTDRVHVSLFVSAVEKAVEAVGRVVWHVNDFIDQGHPTNIERDNFVAAIKEDYKYLLSKKSIESSSIELFSTKLWPRDIIPRISRDWVSVSSWLIEVDPSYSAWIEWFERRLAGEVAGFDIPGDLDRREDQQILMRLAQATNEDFWSKGAVHVNTTLQGWLDEARARVAQPNEETLPEAPEQDRSAITYGVNSEGKVDRLPASDQRQLRDEPDQRQIYADAREAFEDLRAEGQRLGETLTAALDRIMRSMPEAFEDAQAYHVWRDGNRLRRILLAHQAVISSPGPDPAKLDLAVAAQLNEALKLYNLFAFGDEGLRAKDENAIPLQERISGAREAELAKPVVAAILANPDIATPDVRDDVRATLDDSDVLPDNPYAPHTIDQNNRTWRNLIAAVVAYGRTHPVTAFVGLNLAAGMTSAAGEAIFTDVMGTTQVYAPLINFIVANAPAIKAYALTAYSNGSVGIIIDAIVRQVRGVE